MPPEPMTQLLHISSVFFPVWVYDYNVVAGYGFKREEDAMQRLTFCTAVLSVLAMAGVTWAGLDKISDETQKLSLALDLDDGSRIIGIPSFESVPIQTSYAKMDIKLKEVLNIRIEEDHEKASVDLRNGDKLKGVINLELIKLETIFGKVKIGVEHIRELRVTPSLPASLKDGLVLDYSFDRDEGGKVTDRSGKDSQGVVRGAKWISRNREGGAYWFNGGNDIIYATNSVTVSDNSDYTICTWFKKSGNGTMGIVRIGTETGGRDQNVLELSLTVMDSSHLVARVDQCQIDARLTSSFQVQNNIWYHAVLVYSKSKVSLYANGNYIGSIANDLTGGIPGNMGVTRIGSDWTYVSECPFVGLIGDVRVYSRALSPEEITCMYRVDIGRHTGRTDEQTPAMISPRSKLFHSRRRFEMPEDPRMTDKGLIS